MNAEHRWREEKQSAWLYLRLAEVEPDPRKAELFRSLAAAAEKQAALALAGEREGAAAPAFRPERRARLAARLVRLVGPARARPVLAALKVRGLSVYLGDSLAAGHPMPLDVASIGRRHRRGGSGGSPRAAVFGVNDGLVSTASLVLGIAGASAEPDLILLTGVAGLLAGAFSMAAGEYVSVRSQRELLERQIAEERDELERYPEEEAEELALVYNARGVPMEEARALTRRVLQDPEKALAALAREELGLNPDDLGSPWRASIWSFAAFASGALVPLLPFLFGLREHGLAATATL